MKKIVALVSLALFVGVAAWWLSGPRVHVVDVRKAETLVLTRRHNYGSVYAFSMHITGHIQGHATLTLRYRNGETYRVRPLHGDVDFEWGGDWYSDVAEVRYEPNDDVTDGRLTIRYALIAL